MGARKRPVALPEIRRSPVGEKPVLPRTRRSGLLRIPVRRLPSIPATPLSPLIPPIPLIPLLRILHLGRRARLSPATRG